MDVDLIIPLWRQRVDLRRAELRLNLQCQSVVRRFCDGDKVAAGKTWKEVQKGEADGNLTLILTPYLEAMGRLDDSATGIEKQLRKADQLRLWKEWGADVRGVGPLMFAGMLGEAGRELHEYRSVSALWKRFGLAVIEGQRQRRVANDAELAILHGYNAQRRSFAYNLAECLMRKQGAEDPYRALYDRRKAFEAAKEGLTKAHVHNRALRVMTKELLKDAWVASRDQARAA